MDGSFVDLDGLLGDGLMGGLIGRRKASLSDSLIEVMGGINVQNSRVIDSRARLCEDRRGTKLEVVLF